MIYLFRVTPPELLIFFFAFPLVLAIFTENYFPVVKTLKDYLIATVFALPCSAYFVMFVTAPNKLQSLSNLEFVVSYGLAFVPFSAWLGLTCVLVWKITQRKPVSKVIKEPSPPAPPPPEPVQKIEKTAEQKLAEILEKNRR